MPQSKLPLDLVLTDHRLAKLNHLRRLSYLWDKSLSVPGTSFRVGLESLVGILPVGGDIVGMVLSTYILLQAVQLGLPKAVLVRMVLNIVLDGVVGSVPILGDLFDTAWKANTRNVNLLEAHLRSPQSSRNADRWFFFLLFAGLMLVMAALTAVGVIAIQLLMRAVAAWH